LIWQLERLWGAHAAGASEPIEIGIGIGIGTSSSFDFDPDPDPDASPCCSSAKRNVHRPRVGVLHQVPIAGVSLVTSHHAGMMRKANNLA
jgi:hypothetical protein